MIHQSSGSDKQRLIVIFRFFVSLFPVLFVGIFSIFRGFGEIRRLAWKMFSTLS